MKRLFGPMAYAITVCVSCVTPPLLAQTSTGVTIEDQYAQIQSWEGRWRVEEVPALTIEFERTAGGHTMVERWLTSSGTHSITVYHLDGERLVATHYCPQGNQPTLEAGVSNDAPIQFAFRSVKGLDEGESHTHSLEFEALADGGLQRTEVYRSPAGLGEPGRYTLYRVATQP